MSREAEFLAYHQANPQMYQAYEQFALQLAKYRTRLSSAMISERIRWETAISGTKPYKVRNNFRSYYSRLLQWKHPLLRGRFKMTPLTVDGTGPDIHDVTQWDQTYWSQF